MFNEPCDFRYFTEFIAPGAFKNALKVKPLEVVSNIQHDDRWILGHTLNGTLALREDEIGLHQWTRVAPTSYAEDLRVLIDRGDIQQASFAFTIDAEEWEYIDKGKDTEEVKVTITSVGVLYDVTVCALGAYRQTDVEIEAASRSRLDRAIRQGRVRGLPDAKARRMIGSTSDQARRKRRAGSVQSAEAAQRKRDLELARMQLPAGSNLGPAAARRKRDMELARMGLPAPRKLGSADVAIARARIAAFDPGRLDGGPV